MNWCPGYESVAAGAKNASPSSYRRAIAEYTARFETSKYQNGPFGASKCQPEQGIGDRASASHAPSLKPPAATH